jgi:hypothetical protein
MSFAGTVKDELFKHVGASRHCRLAELSALVSFGGIDICGEGEDKVTFSSDNRYVTEKCFTLLTKTFNIGWNEEEKERAGTGGSFRIDDRDEIRKLRQVLNGDLLLQKSCCMRAYLRGAFLAAGSVSDPKKSYHFEIVCRDRRQAVILLDIMKHFDISAREVERKNRPVVYLKEGSSIVDILNVMEAHVALMEFENSRILKEVRNSLNRRVNCETANIDKTVTAAVKQAEDIRVVMGLPEYRKLPKGLRELAQLRLDNPDASLKELGEMCDPPLGKSGVNHRLRKISALAEKGQGK